MVDGDGLDVPDALCDWLDEFCEPSSAASAAMASVADASDDKRAGEAPVTPHEIGVPSDSCVEWVKEAAASLDQNGFCVLRSPTDDHLLSAAAREACAADAVSKLTRLLDRARALGIDPKRDVLRYREVCARAPSCRRYDMRVPVHRVESYVGGGDEGGGDGDGDWNAAWRSLHAAVYRLVSPVLRAASLMRSDEATASASAGAGGGVVAGNVVHVDSAGCVLSLPGAPEQHWHPDGTARGLVNVFVPLVPLTLENGATELRPGSHVWDDSGWGAAPRGRRDAPSVLPLVRAGEVLLFDYRCYHRGRANLGMQPRPIAYLLLARPGVSDSHNFPTESIWDDDAAPSDTDDD